MKTLIVIFILTFLIGCQTTPNNTNGSNVGQQISNISSSIDNITNRSRQIMGLSDDISSRTTDEEIKSRSNNIKENANAIISETSNLEKVKTSLGQTERLVLEQKKKIEELERSLRDKTTAGLAWLILIGVAGVGLSGLLFLIKPQAAIWSIIGFGGLTVSAITFSAFWDWIVIGGGIIFLVSIGYLAYQIFIRNKAIGEIVRTVEVIKSEKPEEPTKSVSKLNARKEADKIFKDGGFADIIQSKETKELVKLHRKKIKN